MTAESEGPNRRLVTKVLPGRDGFCNACNRDLPTLHLRCESFKGAFTMRLCRLCLCGAMPAIRKFLRMSDHIDTFKDVPPWCSITCHACPTQAEGRLTDGRRWYFRARHGDWRIDLADNPGEDPIGNTKFRGEDPSSGWMPGCEVVRLLELHLGDEIDRSRNEEGA